MAKHRTPKALKGIECKSPSHARLIDCRNVLAEYLEDFTAAIAREDYFSAKNFLRCMEIRVSSTESSIRAIMDQQAVSK